MDYCDKINSLLKARTRTLIDLKELLYYELSSVLLIHYNFVKKFKRVYSEKHDTFFCKDLVRCYFPKENLCLIMSINQAHEFPIVSTILSNNFQEKCIQTKFYDEKTSEICNGPLLVILNTETKSIILDTNRSLYDKLLSVTIY